MSLDAVVDRGVLRMARNFCTIVCEEMFATRGGDEWHVSHYRWVKR